MYLVQINKRDRKNLRSSFSALSTPRHNYNSNIWKLCTFVQLNLKPCNFIDRYTVNLNTIERKNRKK